MQNHDQIEGLLSDLGTITDIARAGVISKRDERLEPGERRLVAVLFLDVVGFTPLTKQLGSEQITKLIDRTFRIFELTVKAQGGYHTGFAGDAVHYTFAGHPNYPSVCEAALRAALKLQERVRQVNESLHDTGLSIEIRIGVSFGEVTVQAVGSEGATQTIMGETINIAQRLESTAKPGAINTSIRVIEKAGDIFHTKPIGKQDLKGIGDVTIYEVTGIEEPPVDLRGAFTKLTPLVGRDGVMEQATRQIASWWKTSYEQDTWDITQTSTPLKGRNRLLILNGVAAVGKSRVAYELIQKLKDQHSVSTATAHCTDNTSLQSFTGELARVAGLTPDNLPRRWDELCANASECVSHEYADRQQRHLQVLAYVLDCDQVDTSGIRQTDAASFEINCKLAIRACCELAAHFSKKPVVLVLEDLQWMGSLQALITDMLERASLPQPLVVIGTARPEYEHENNSLGEGEHLEITLPPFGADQGSVIMQALLPGLEMSAALVSELHEKAAGLPYYYEELARMLVRRGQVKEENGTYRLTSTLDNIEMPEDIQTLVLGRLDQLEPELKALTQRASVLGRSFQLDLLEKIEMQLGFDSENHPERNLGLLLRKHVLEKEDGENYYFEHVLLRDAAYGALLKANRELLHSVTADILKVIHVPGLASEISVLPMIAFHLFACDRYQEALEYSCELLKVMVSTWNLDNWEKWEDFALKAWKIGRTEHQNKIEVPAHLLYALARLDMGRCLEEAAHLKLCRALELAHEDRNQELEGHILISLSALEEDTDTRLVSCKAALSIAENCGDNHLVYRALANISGAFQTTGQLIEASAFTDRAVEVARSIGNPRITLQSLVLKGNRLAYIGKMEEAKECILEALSISQQNNDRLNESRILVSISMLERENSINVLEKVLGYYREIGSVSDEMNVLSDLVFQCEASNEFEKGMGYVQSYLEIAKLEISDVSQAFGYAQMGLLYRSVQNYSQEAGALEKALSIYDSIQDSYGVGWIRMELGFNQVAIGNLSNAREHLIIAEECLSALDDKRLLGFLHCAWTHYHLAIPEAHSTMMAYNNASKAINKAGNCAEKVQANEKTELGVYINKARQAIENFEREHELTRS